MRKNFYLYARNWKITVLQLLNPIVFLLLLFVLQKISETTTNNVQVPNNVDHIPLCYLNSEKICFTVLYAPNTNIETNAIMQMLATNNNPPLSIGTYVSDKVTLAPGAPMWDILSFPNDQVMQNFIIAHPNTTQSAVTFLADQNNASSPVQGYIVYHNVTNVYDQEVTGAMLWALARASLSLRHSANITLQVQVAGYPQSQSQTLPDEIVWSTGPLWFFCPAMFNFILFTHQFVQEKERRVRLAMRTMGLADVWFWLSWFVLLILVALVHTLVLLAVGYLFQFTFLLQTSVAVLFVVFLLYALALVSLALFCGVFIEKASNANAIAFLLFVIGFFMQLIFVSFSIYIWFDPSNSIIPRIIFSFFPPFNYAKCLADITTVTWPLSSYPNHTYFWSTLYNSIRVDQQDGTQIVVAPTVQSLYILLGNFGLYGLLALYFDSVIPQPHDGSPLPFYFVVNPVYWWRRCCGSCCRKKKQQHGPEVELKDVAEKSEETEGSGTPAVVVKNLIKRYRKYPCCRSRKDAVAVNNLSFQVAEGQLFCLLGHNGAGKTTTLSILTGIIRADAGDAWIYGHSVRREISTIRQFIGLCPQFDILWDELTAREHLELYAALKGIPRRSLRNEALQKLKEVNLEHVANQRVSTFSGGMRRRLSVAISLIGNPKIVFMDEPTTGMDPQNRSEVWRVIERTKQQRIVVLTTHSMEEANVLSDIIGIMAAGRLKCFGSASALKRQYGEGFYLRLISNASARRIVKRAIRTLVPASRLVTTNADDLVFNFSVSEFSSLKKLFAFLNHPETKDLVRDWGLSYTTLEEVFLKVTTEEIPTDDKEARFESHDPPDMETKKDDGDDDDDDDDSNSESNDDNSNNAIKLQRIIKSVDNNSEDIQQRQQRTPSVSSSRSSSSSSSNSTTSSDKEHEQSQHQNNADISYSSTIM